MPRFKYQGSDLNLGRHGFVQTGQVLELTPREALSVADNPDFKPITGDVKDPNAIRYGLEEMNREDLYDKAVEMKASGLTLSFNKSSSKQHLLRELKEALGIAPVREAEQTETEDAETEKQP